MREPKPAWIAALRALTGCETDDIRFNTLLHRWEFSLAGADGISRSQFFGVFSAPVDPVTGLHPFRELDDDAMAEALGNLERTFVGNPYDGAGSPWREILRRQGYNEAHMREKYRRAGELFADMVAERGHRLRGSPLIAVGMDVR
jgi:hypothetical protein